MFEPIYNPKDIINFPIISDPDDINLTIDHLFVKYSSTLSHLFEDIDTDSIINIDKIVTPLNYNEQASTFLKNFILYNGNEGNESNESNDNYFEFIKMIVDNIFGGHIFMYKIFDYFGCDELIDFLVEDIKKISMHKDNHIFFAAWYEATDFQYINFESIRISTYDRWDKIFKNWIENLLSFDHYIKLKSAWYDKAIFYKNDIHFLLDSNVQDEDSLTSFLNIQNWTKNKNIIVDSSIFLTLFGKKNNIKKHYISFYFKDVTDQNINRHIDWIVKGNKLDERDDLIININTDTNFNLLEHLNQKPLKKVALLCGDIIYYTPEFISNTDTIHGSFDILDKMLFDGDINQYNMILYKSINVVGFVVTDPFYITMKTDTLLEVLTYKNEKLVIHHDNDENLKKQIAKNDPSYFYIAILYGSRQSHFYLKYIKNLTIYYKEIYNLFIK